MKRLILFILLISVYGKSYSQCGPTQTLYAGNNGQDGIMFDITAVNNVILTNFDVDAYGITHTYEIYYKVGTHVGFTNNAAAWTLIGTAPNVPGNPRNTPTAIPITFSLPMCPGDTYGFYITSTAASGSISYTNGTAVGNVQVNDGNIQVKQGTGKDYPFAANFTTRIPNITVYYQCSTGCCVPPTMSSAATSCSTACDGTATATVTGGFPPFTYQWDAAAGNQTTATASGLCAGTYVVNVTDNNGCTAQGTVTVAAGPAPPVVNITPAGPFCTGNAATNLVASIAGGTWSGTGITNAANGTFDPAVAGIGSHVITYTLPGTCGATDTETIVVNASQDASITPAGPFCSTSPAVNLVAATAGGTWSGTGITNAANGTFDPAVSGNGSFVITYTIAGACGATDTETVTVNSSLSSAITAAGPFCTGDAALNLTAANAGGTWSGNGITDATNGTFDPATAGVGTHTITYTIPGACGSSSTSDITVGPNADATISAAGPFCTVSPATNLVAANTGGTWSGTGITDAANGTFDPSVSGSGSFVITYTIAGACGASDTETIVVNLQADATVTAAGPFCESSSAVNLSAADAGGTWSGNGITDASNGTFDPATAGAGTHTITYTIGGACGDVQNTSIVVNPDMDATINPAGPYCVNSPAVNLSAADAGGTWSGTGITDPAVGTFDPSIAGAGTFSITYTIAGACGDTYSMDILVNTNDDATITAVSPLCVDAAPVTLTAATAGGTWTGNGITNAANGTFDPATAGAGTHTITYTIAGACGDTQTTDILVNPLPVVSFSADQTSGCAPVLVNFTNTSASSVSCAWDFGNGQTSTDCTPAAISFLPGTYNVTLSISDANGCSATLTNNNMIESFDYPVAEFGHNPQPATIYNPLIYFGNNSVGASDYEWDFAGLGSSVLSDPSFIFPDAGTYPVTLYATSANGCVDSVTHMVVIGEELIVYAPNAFTANGDGRNDVFLPVVSGVSDNEGSYELFIFNRWGEQVFYTNQLNEGWDGTYRGQTVENGVYVYRIQVVDNRQEVKHVFVGHVSMLK